MTPEIMRNSAVRMNSHLHLIELFENLAAYSILKPEVQYLNTAAASPLSGTSEGFTAKTFPPLASV